MEEASLGGLTLHQHKDALPQPGMLLQKLLKSRILELRMAAELQACSRRPVIWRCLAMSGQAAQTSLFEGLHWCCTAGGCRQA